MEAEFNFPPYTIKTFEHDLPDEVVAYIAALETALGQYELLAERLNTDRIEAHRTMRMREYAERMKSCG